MLKLNRNLPENINMLGYVAFQHGDLPTHLELKLSKFMLSICESQDPNNQSICELVAAMESCLAHPAPENIIKLASKHHEIESMLMGGQTASSDMLVTEASANAHTSITLFAEKLYLKLDSDNLHTMQFSAQRSSVFLGYAIPNSMIPALRKLAAAATVMSSFVAKALNVPSANISNIDDLDVLRKASYQDNWVKLC